PGHVSDGKPVLGAILPAYDSRGSRTSTAGWLVGRGRLSARSPLRQLVHDLARAARRRCAKSTPANLSTMNFTKESRSNHELFDFYWPFRCDPLHCAADIRRR